MEGYGEGGVLFGGVVGGVGVAGCRLQVAGGALSGVEGLQNTNQCRLGSESRDQLFNRGEPQSSNPLWFSAPAGRSAYSLWFSVVNFRLNYK